MRVRVPRFDGGWGGTSLGTVVSSSHRSVSTSSSIPPSPSTSPFHVLPGSVQINAFNCAALIVRLLKNSISLCDVLLW